MLFYVKQFISRGILYQLVYMTCFSIYSFFKLCDCSYSDSWTGKLICTFGFKCPIIWLANNVFLSLLRLQQIKTIKKSTLFSTDLLKEEKQINIYKICVDLDYFT